MKLSLLLMLIILTIILMGCQQQTQSATPEEAFLALETKLYEGDLDYYLGHLYFSNSLLKNKNFTKEEFNDAFKHAWNYDVHPSFNFTVKNITILKREYLNDKQVHLVYKTYFHQTERSIKDPSLIGGTSLIYKKGRWMIDVEPILNGEVFFISPIVFVETESILRGRQLQKSWKFCDKAVKDNWKDNFQKTDFFWLEEEFLGKKYLVLSPLGIKEVKSNDEWMVIKISTYSWCNEYKYYLLDKKAKILYESSKFAIDKVQNITSGNERICSHDDACVIDSHDREEFLTQLYGGIDLTSLQQIKFYPANKGARYYLEIEAVREPNEIEQKCKLNIDCYRALREETGDNSICNLVPPFAGNNYVSVKGYCLGY